METNETTALFAWRNDDGDHLYHIKSVNALGETEETGVLRVHSRRNDNRKLEQQYELKEHSIAKIYHNNSYTLNWKPPLNTVDLLNYTVFWCLPKIELPNQCKVCIFRI